MVVFIETSAIKVHNLDLNFVILFIIEVKSSL